MTAAELVAWQRRCGLANDEQAAAALGLSAVTYRRKRTGHAPVTRQTELLCAYYEVFSLRLTTIAVAVERIAEVTRVTLPPSVHQAARVIEKAIGHGRF